MDANAAWADFVTGMNTNNEELTIPNARALARWLYSGGFVPEKATAAGFTREGLRVMLCAALLHGLS